nr:PREDICTED: transcription elongation factor B polypeptide 3-like [Bemisia tabaci]
MSVPESKIISAIEHYQKSIRKHEHNKEKLLYYLGKLAKFPMTVSILQKTMVGLQINALRKYDGDVGNAAKVLVTKWKDVVRKESEGDYSDEEGEEEKEDTGNRNNHSDDSGVDNDVEDGDRDSDEKSADQFLDTKPANDKNDAKNCKRLKEENRHSSSHKSKHSDKHKNHDSVRSSRDSSSKKSSHDSRKSRQESNSSRDSDHKKSKHENKKRKYSSESQSDLDQNDSDSSQSTRSSKKRKIESSGDGSESDSSTSDSDNKKSRDKREKNNSAHHHHSSKHRDSSHKKTDEKKVSKSTTKTSHSSERRKEKESDRSSKKDKPSKEIHEHHKSKSVKTEVKVKLEKDDSKTSRSEKESSKSQTPVKVKQEKDSMAVNSFEAALMGFSSPTEQPKIKVKSKSSSSSKSGSSSSEKKGSHSSESKPSKVLSSPSASLAEVDLFPEVKSDLDIDITSSLPELADVYRPLPHLENKRERPKLMSEDEALASIMTTKNQRTKVYSGNKASYTKVPSLFELCTRVLIDNIDLLEYTGGVPYDILKPIIERASPEQLFTLEFHNDYLKVDTDVHWKFHCQRDFRDKTRKEDETWRDFYVRCMEERQQKLERLTNNITRSIAESAPVRKTKLAYLDTAVKPPRNVMRKQAKHGTGSGSAPSSSKHDIIAKAVKGEGSSSKSSEAPVKVSSPSMQRAANYVNNLIKKKKAPLMQKTLQFIKGNRFKR